MLPDHRRTHRRVFGRHELSYARIERRRGLHLHVCIYVVSILQKHILAQVNFVGDVVIVLRGKNACRCSGTKEKMLLSQQLPFAEIDVDTASVVPPDLTEQTARLRCARCHTLRLANRDVYRLFCCGLLHRFRQDTYAFSTVWLLLISSDKVKCAKRNCEN